MEMKGRVACEMGSHELMITELLFESAFSELEPPEVAAILSCMVFQQVRFCNMYHTKFTFTHAEPKVEIKLSASFLSNRDPTGHLN